MKREPGDWAQDPNALTRTCKCPAFGMQHRPSQCAVVEDDPLSAAKGVGAAFWALVFWVILS